MPVARFLDTSVLLASLEESVLPFVQVQTLSGQDVMAALADCPARGVRGGAIYDWLHLAASRQAGADAFVTLNFRDFQALTRPGDPLIEAP